jgi:hypothetical protein
VVRSGQDVVPMGFQSYGSAERRLGRAAGSDPGGSRVRIGQALEAWSVVDFHVGMACIEV